MARKKDLGERLASVAIDTSAALYVVHKAAQVRARMEEMLVFLDEHARVFHDRVDTCLQENLAEGADAYKRAVLADLEAEELGPYRIAECHAMIEAAGGGDEFKRALWLLGEDMILPADLPPREDQADEGEAPRPPAPKGQAAQAQAKPAAAPAASASRTAPREGTVVLDEFFKIPVPGHELDKARLILQDARERAFDEGHFNNSPYLASRGVNSWQSKLLREAFAVALLDRRNIEAAQAASLEPASEEQAPQETAAQDEPVQEDEDTAPAAYVEDGDAPAESDSSDQEFSEPVEEMADEAPELTLPLQPAVPRPAPRVVGQPPQAAAPARPAPGAGLMASRVAPLGPRPSFLTPRPLTGNS